MKTKYGKVIVFIIIIFLVMFFNIETYSAEIISADGKWKYFIKNNVIYLCEYLGTEKTVEIPKNIDGYEVKYIPGFGENECVEHIKIPSTVISLGDLFGPFVSCKNLKTVEIEEGELKSTGLAFQGCSNLTSVKLPTNIKTIELFSFMGCNSLTTFNTGYIEKIKALAFSGCKNLETLNIDENLTEIDINAFGGCEKLSQINIDNNNKNFVLADGVLYNADKTKIIFYPLAKEEKEYNIPNTVTTLETFNIENRYLESININKELENIATKAFAYIENLKQIKVNEENLQYKDMDGVLFDKEVNKLICYPSGKEEKDYMIPHTVTSIESLAFYDNDNLNNLAIPSLVTNISEGAFEECDNLIIYCFSGSAAEAYAIENNIMYDLLDSDKKTIKFKDEAFYNFMKEYLKTKYSILESYNDQTKEIVVNKEKISKVDLINIQDKGIKDLTGIENFTNLTHLYASNNEIEDIAPLKNLTKISYLTLSNNKIKNIDALEKLVNISELQLENNQILNIEMLRNLNKLDRVFLSTNNIMNIEPLSNLSNISLLVIKDNTYTEDKKEINILKNEKVEIELPTIFKYSEQEGNLIYTSKELELTNCKIEENKIILDTSNIGEQTAIITIKDGAACGTTYKIEYIVKDSNVFIEGSIYKIENEAYIINILPQTKIKEFKTNIKEDYGIELYKNSSEIIDENTNIETGMVVKINKGMQEKEYKIVVIGDLNGDGQMNDIDLLMLARYKAKLYNGLTEEYLRASEIVQNGTYADDMDLLKMARILAKLDKI